MSARGPLFSSSIWGSVFSTGEGSCHSFLLGGGGGCFPSSLSLLYGKNSHDKYVK
jgi:hypothetical protein